MSLSRIPCFRALVRITGSTSSTYLDSRLLSTDSNPRWDQVRPTWVRIDPELRAAIEARAEAEHTTTSEIIREAIRRFLEVA